jgi:diacylglycerol kinase (ATP)
MNKVRKIALIVNPLPENHRARTTGMDVSKILNEKKISHRVFDNEWPNDFDEFTGVWIVGGDGTMNYFINKYPLISLPLSLFKGGSGNDLNWMLYANRSTPEQVEHVLNADPVSVDAGICNGRLFINGLGIGFDGAIVKDLEGKRKIAGKVSYLISILKHIIGYAEKPFKILYDEQVLSQDCFMISIANARRYGGGFMVAPLAEITDGVLDMNIVGQISPLKRMRYLPVIEKGEHLSLPFVKAINIKKVLITSPSKVHAHVDGEYFSSDKFEIEILPARFSFLY